MIDDRKKEVGHDDLVKQVAVLADKVAKLEHERHTKHNAQAKLLEYAADETKFVSVIKTYERRLETLSRRLQTYLNRECILTEVMGYVRRKGSADLIVHFSHQLMIAYDWDDEFWEQSGSFVFTIQEWFDKIMALEAPTPKDYNVELMLPK